MFWINFNIIKDFFNNYINDNQIKKFEYGYFPNNKPTFTHSWERMFAIIIEFNNKKIVGL